MMEQDPEKKPPTFHEVIRLFAWIAVFVLALALLGGHG